LGICSLVSNFCSELKEHLIERQFQQALDA
jgi:hypothetical protein